MATALTPAILAEPGGTSLGVYLAPAEYIDSEHPEIVALAEPWRELSGPADRARAVFGFVRDIPYEADDFDLLDTFRASHVLSAGHGYCVSKAALGVALARAAGVPARIAFADVRNHLGSPRLREAMGTDVFAWHGYIEFRLRDRWVKASPTFDPPTCERAGVPPLEFDGVSDALLQAFGGGEAMEYVAYHGSFHDVPARFLSAEMMRLYPFTRDQGITRYKAGRASGRAARPAGPLISIAGLDHLVLTVADVERSVGFYQQVLGMRPVTFGSGRRALRFGSSKINLHQAGREIAPHAARPLAGSADLCLVTTARPDQVVAQLRARDVAVEEGPVQRTGALGPITSVYVRDPDGNLIEIANYPG
jgi:catechol 2,3-dioxygenase-like lactoylglutathione lyase family enzyme